MEIPNKGHFGSSPLARGLLDLDRVGVVLVGIIPARAGFTLPSSGVSTRTPDHPRSRGVYGLETADQFIFQGSSPLARGLLAGDKIIEAQGRIIPARAGFTPRSGIILRARSDHPRSRGVYTIITAGSSRSRGSSPLARGLPWGGAARGGCSGIIPARAGFTHRGRSRRADPEDHPRSRGVYSSGSPTTRVVLGSSPLARGLLDLAGDVLEEARIIPARAGFTCDRFLSAGSSGDHPRSRGVYSSATPMRLPWIGSSPLARGLPLSALTGIIRLRIIPARAGFTPSQLPSLRKRSDHPRSRGVYSATSSLVQNSGGSSPLARGLR